MKLTESGMEFDFPAFNFAEYYDTPENQCAGLKIVDFIAENAELHFFIEVKNYENVSDDPAVQAAINVSQAESYQELCNPNDFARKMIKKFEHSLFIWIATGNYIKKPVYMLLVFNTPKSFAYREREMLLTRLGKYIPKSGKNHIVFDVPPLDKVREFYGFSVSAQSAAPEKCLT
jgi:hypothetical protein